MTHGGHKHVLSLLTAVMLTVSVFATDSHITCNILFVPNPNLPRDCVEAVWTTANAGAIDCLYTERGVDHPKSPTMVQIAIYTVTDDGTVKWCGWSWMEAEEVNRLHQPDIGVAYNTL